MRTLKSPTPTLEEEMALFQQGYCFIAGLDEAGRGCLAGPVVAAAVILPLPLADDALARFAGVRDSKLLTAQTRETLYKSIMQHALAVGVGIGPVELIEEQNILQATKHAMRFALTQLSLQPQALLLDAVRLPTVPLPQRSIVKGDALCLSIAAASIIAKVTRDRMMLVLHEQYPVYGFSQHKGYGTELHLAALKQHGPCPIHRKTFSPIREQLGLFPETDAVHDLAPEDHAP